MKQKIKWFFIGLFIFYILVGFFALPYVLEKTVPSVISDATKGQFEIEAISFNPFFFELGIEGVRFANVKGEDIFTLKQGSINLELTSLLSGTIHLRSLHVVKPRFNLVHLKEGGLNIDWLIKPDVQPDTKEDPRKENEALSRVIIDEFALYEGSISFLDLTKKELFDVELGPISLNIKHIDTRNLENSDEHIRFHTKISDGASLDIKSDILSLSPPAFRGSIDFTSGKAHTLWRYLQEITQLEIADGKIDLHLNFHVASTDIEKTRIDNLQLALTNLRIKPKTENQDILHIRQITLKDGLIMPFAQQVEIDKVTMDTISIFAKRGPDRTINWIRYISAAETKESAEVHTVEKNATKTAWDVTLNRFALHDLTVTFEDNAVVGSATSVVDKIAFNASNINSKAQHQLEYNASMRINQKGLLEISGSLSHTPLQQKGTLSVENLQLSDLNPYLSEQMFVAIESGALSLKTEMSYAPSTSNPDLSLRGSLSLTDMLVTDTHDKSTLLSFEDIRIKPFTFELAPNNLFIEEIQLNTLFANAFIDKKGSFNLAQLQKVTHNDTSEIGGDVDQSAPDTFPVKIIKVSIADSSANFADFSLPLRFQTHIRNINGTVYAVSSTPKETSYVDLGGVVDRYGSAKLKGSINTANPKYFTDLALTFRNLSLNSYTPYSTNFVGRKIDEGKLFLDLRYHIVDSQLLGENSMIIKKIKLGNKVVSKEAVSLPLGLAIALLEDSEGVIDIELPIEGDMDKPDFKYATLVWKTLGNLITKAATTPFRFLGALLGMEGDSLEFIAFEPGRAILLPPEQEKLDALSKALKKRPRLSLGVSGCFDTVSDKRAMQLEKVRAAAFSIAKSGRQIEAKEALNTAVLEALYRKSQGEKAPELLQKKLRKTRKDDLAFQERYNKALWNALADLQKVTDEELKSLGTRRAQGITTYLSVSQGIAPERIKPKKSVSSSVSAQKWVKTRLSIEVKQETQ